MANFKSVHWRPECLAVREAWVANELVSLAKVDPAVQVPPVDRAAEAFAAVAASREAVVVACSAGAVAGLLVRL